MSGASHRIVGVVELEPQTGLFPIPAVSDRPTARTGTRQPQSTLSQSGFAESASRSGQAILADTSRLQHDLEVEFSRFVASV